MDRFVIGTNGVSTVYDFYPSSLPPSVQLVARTWEAQDVSGNKAFGSQVISVVDTAPPAMTCPSPMMVPSPAGQCSAVAAFAATAHPSGCATSIVVNCLPPSGSTFPAGANTVTCTATDGVGNSASCSFVVTVLSGLAPQFVSAIRDVTLPLGSNCSLNVPDFASITVASDPCGASLITVTQNPPTNAMLVVGANMITLYASDNAGHVTASNLVLTLTANPPVPGVQSASTWMNTPLILLASKLIQNDTSPDGRAMFISGVAPLSSSNGTVTFDGTSIRYVPPLGFTTSNNFDVFIYTNQDCAGLTAPVPVQVRVRVDSTPPLIRNCPADIVAGNDPGLCGAVVTWIEPTVTDNSGYYTVKKTRSPGSFFPLGTTLVTYTATDPSGNRSICKFSVTVSDTEAPRFLTFPANQTLSLGTNCSVKAPDLTSSVTVSEHCNDLVTVTQSPPANTILALGPNTITIFASDSHTNVAMSNVIVTVVANPPVFAAFPTNQILALGSNCSLSVPNLVTNAMAFDTCYNLVTVTQSPPASVNLAVGVNTITLYAPDTYGNVTTSNVTITVTANPPIAGVQTAGTRTNTAVTLSAAKFLANDISPDGRTMAVVGVTAVSTNGGKVTFNGINSIVYLPPTNYAGLDAFTYTNRDCGGLSTPVQVVVTVRATLHVMELDAPATLSITSLTIAADGVLTLVADGVPGVTYAVQRTQNLGPAAWTTVAKIVADDNGQVIYHESNAQSPSFYRTKEVTTP